MKRLLPIILLVLILGASMVAWRPTSPDQSPTPLEVSLSILPETILQGDPVLVVIDGLDSPSIVESLKVGGKEVSIFIHDNKPSALVGVDLKSKTGPFPITLTLADGREFEGEFVVGVRSIVKVPLGIPEKLGGDTPESERKLVETLVEEAATISAVPTSPEKLWSGKFRWPLEAPVVTEPYGNSRLTGRSVISHKGADFRADVGTPVYAMNAGLVRFADYLRNYGHTIIIDHGLGLQTIYMHLSRIEIEEGEKVNKGQLIASSGESGYAFGPHLHLSVRIGGVSIDPERFMALWLRN